MQELMMKMMMGDFKSVFSDIPPGLDVARAHMLQLIKELECKFTIPITKMVLCGFSQGEFFE